MLTAGRAGDCGKAKRKPESLYNIPTGWYFLAMNQATRIPRGEARRRILDAALNVIRAQGYSATSVDDLCKAAGVTKGAFFHHFASKEELGVAAAQHWSDMTGGLFAGADYHRHADPLDRVLGYIDFRRDILAGEVSEFTCLVGTMVQEIYDTHPDLRAACNRTIASHVATLVEDIRQAREMHAPDADWSAESLAWHTQAVLQGAFILAKAKGGAAIAADSVRHLRRYVEMLFAEAPAE